MQIKTITFLLIITSNIYSQSIDWKLFDQSNSPITKNSTYFKLAADSLGGMWVVADFQLLHYSRGKWTSQTDALKNYSEENSAYITAMGVDGKNKLYLGLNHKSFIYCFDLTWTRFENNLELVHPTSISFDAKNNLWIGYINYWNSASQMFKDKIGFFDGSNWKINNVYALSGIIAQENSALIVGGLPLATNYGLFKIENRDSLFGTSMFAGDIGKYIGYMPGSLNDKIIIYKDSLLVFENNNVFAESAVNSFLKSHNAKILCVSTTVRNSIWFGTDQGYLLKYNSNGDLKAFNFINEITQKNKRILNLCVDSNENIWAAVDSLGLIEFKEDKIVSVNSRKGNVIPTEFLLEQNFPNPFNASTNITFSLPKRSRVMIKIYDITGREIMNIANGIYDAGLHNVNFNALNFNSGIYFYALVAEEFFSAKKMILLK